MPTNDQPSRRLIGAGYALGVLLPIVGFFVGLALLLKNRAGHGIAVMVVSVAVAGTVATTIITRSTDDKTAPKKAQEPCIVLDNGAS